MTSTSWAFGRMYDEYSTMTDAPPIIVPYQMTLMGRHRHLGVQFVYNTKTERTMTTKKDDSSSLSGILRHRFGSDAIGVLVGGKAEYYEDEMIRSGRLPLRGGKFHVLYDDSAPPYSSSSSSRPPESLPTFHEAEQESDIKGGDGKMRVERRVLGLTYYESVPTLTHLLSILTADGTTHQLRLSNKTTDRTDPVAAFLATKGGDRSVAILVDDQEFIDDNILFAAGLREGTPYQVTYRPPSSINVLAKALDKRRNVIYSKLPFE